MSKDEAGHFGTPDLDPAGPSDDVVAEGAGDATSGQHDITMPLLRGKHGAEHRRRALVAAATAVFADKGYDSATTREVAERSGCSEGLIHRYFGGKHGLLLAILGNKADDVMAQSSAAMPPRETLGEEIEQLLLWPLEMFWQQRDFMRVCVSQSAIDAEVGRMIGDRLNGTRVRFMTERLRLHQAAGRVRRDIDPGAIALAMSGLNISMGFFGQVVFEMDHETARSVARETARVLTAGLMPRPGATTEVGREKERAR